MPVALLRPCTTVGCAELTTNGSCPAHARLYEQRRGSASSRGYGRRWERYRAWFLSRHPCCGDSEPDAPQTNDSQCAAAGRPVAATCVDHIEPHRGDPHKQWSVTNLRSMCARCHSAKTARQDGGFGHARR